MEKVKIYTTSTCPYCQAAKALLTSKHIAYTEINIDNNPHLRDEMVKLTGKRTVPQIFVNDKPIGGFDELNALNQSGQLEKLLK